MCNPIPLLTSLLFIVAAFAGHQTGAADYWAENRPPAGTPRSLPKRLFPADNWWNLNISQAPVDPKSESFIASIGTGSLRYDWGNNYGLPYVTVSGNYPKVKFQGCSYWNETDQMSLMQQLGLVPPPQGH